MSKVTKLLNKIQKLWDLEQPALYDASEDLVAKYADDLQALRIHTGIVYPSQVSDLLDVLYKDSVPESSLKEDLPPYRAYEIHDTIPLDPDMLSGDTLGTILDSVLGKCSSDTAAARKQFGAFHSKPGMIRSRPVIKHPTNIPLVISLDNFKGEDPETYIRELINIWRERANHQPQAMEEHQHQGEPTQEVTTGVDQQDTSLHVYIRNDGTILLDHLHIGKLPKDTSHDEVVRHIRELIGELYPLPKTEPFVESYSAAPSLLKPKDYNPEALTNHFINRKIQLMEHILNSQSPNLDWSNLLPIEPQDPQLRSWKELLQPKEPKEESQQEFNMNARSPYGDFKVLTSNGWISINELALMNPGDHVFIVGFDPRSTK